MNAVGKISASILGSTALLSFLSGDTETQKLIISSVTSVTIYGMSALLKYALERYKLRRIKKSYGYERPKH